MQMPIRCPWCAGPMPTAPNRGKRRRFCQPACRRAFDSAIRAYARAFVEAGLLPAGVLRAWMASQQTRAFISGAISRPPVPLRPRASLDAQRAPESETASRGPS